MTIQEKGQSKNTMRSIFNILPDIVFYSVHGFIIRKKAAILL